MLARRNSSSMVSGPALCLAAVDHEEAAEITAMWIEQRHVHALDPAVGLHSPEHSDELVEHLDSPYLAAAQRLTEPDEQGAICHNDSCRSFDDANLSKQPVARKWPLAPDDRRECSSRH
jgi:hypothetical protein